ncbi:SRPBCC domain-containing protein [Chryseobacterium sp. SNU WT5]|uniref:SRPBCC family protein n=1 Tax=Chryseobacterium sp. SNU WT5 TaxID=2594269 RepID=UPI00117C2C6E|nr:SRPBCC domain-containing protein [Chryseobacterium sp. SNU WT5]QDP84285.1 SRPBCC domain-containing protein [Chryseobacterium sp. SNU WT5]
METLNYEVHINANIQEIWDLLWNEDTYPQWTQFFTTGSKMRSDWKIGGKTYFVDENGDGMVSTIESMNEPYEIVFRHLGLIKDGIEDTESKKVKEWSGAEEKYFLRILDGDKTELRAIVHTDQIQEEAMNEGFNKGFQLLKSIAES